MSKKLEETLLESEEVFRGKIFQVTHDTVKLPNGKEGIRDVVHHNGAVAAVPITPEGDVYLVKQYRHAVGGIVLEIPAGKIELGENSNGAINRELQEEIGFLPLHTKKLTTIYPTPGYTSEKIEIWLATDLCKMDSPKDSDEFIEVVRMPFKQLHAAVVNGEIQDAKTAIGVMLASPYYQLMMAQPSVWK